MSKVRRTSHRHPARMTALPAPTPASSQGTVPIRSTAEIPDSIPYDPEQMPQPQSIPADPDIEPDTRVPELQLAAQSTWDKLPEEYRIIITQCAKESARYERSLWKEREAQSEQNIREAGCIITELSKEEKSRFQAAVMPMYGKYCSDYVDMIDRIVAEGR